MHTVLLANNAFFYFKKGERECGVYIYFERERDMKRERELNLSV